MENKIIDIIVEICEDETIRDNLEIDLIENEILDSLAFITLISRLEEEFDIEIQPTQIPADTWRSVRSIIELVSRGRFSLTQKLIVATATVFLLKFFIRNYRKK